MNAINSIKKIDDGVFFLEFIGDYDFESFLAQGGSKNNDDIATFITGSLSKGKWTGNKNSEDYQVTIKTPDFGCSSIIGKNQNGNPIFGRNYDWQDCSVMVIHTKPDNGYESISTSCLEFVGFDRDWEPENNFTKDIVSLASIYVPLDGMNEKGLYIADLIVHDNEETAQNRGNIPLTITAAIRLVLDNAATVDEAITLLDSYDIHSVIGMAHHFAIADKTGKSVVVEWEDNKMYVSETPVVTNHYVADSPKGKGFVLDGDNSKIRFEKLQGLGNENNWNLDTNQIKNALKSVSASQFSSTEIAVWSCIYEPESNKITYYFRENYDKPYVIEF